MSEVENAKNWLQQTGMLEKPVVIALESLVRAIVREEMQAHKDKEASIFNQVVQELGILNES